MTTIPVNPTHADTAVATLQVMGLSIGPRLIAWLAASETALLDLHIGRANAWVELVDIDNGGRFVWATAYAKQPGAARDIQGALNKLEEFAANFVPLDTDAANG